MTPIASAVPVSEISCGTTIADGDMVYLAKDITGCDDDTNPAITLVGGATLDMMGHSIIANDTDVDGVLGNGVLLVGENAVLKNGTITGFQNDVVLGEENIEFDAMDAGEHEVYNITAKNALTNGACFLVNTPGSSIIKSKALNCATLGVKIMGNDTTIRDMFIDTPGDAGVLAVSEYNTVEHSHTYNTGNEAIKFTRPYNTAIENVIIDPADNGIEAKSQGDYSVFRRNIVVGATNSGFKIDTANNTLENNVSMNNKDGIRITDVGGELNIISSNTAKGNSLNDLLDDSATCGSNIWKLNNYTTSSPSTCIE